MSVDENVELLCKRNWFAELAVDTELECMSILYAKSLLDPSEDVQQKQQLYGAQRIYVGADEKSNDLKPAEPPAKPQRFIARMTSAEKTFVMTAPNFSSCSNNYSKDYRYKATTSPLSMKDEERMKTDLEVAALTTFTRSISQSTQTDNSFLQPQEAKIGATNAADSQNERIDRKQSRNSLICINSTSRLSVIPSINNSIISETSDYDRLPVIDSIDDNVHHFGQLSTSTRSSQRYLSTRQSRARSRESKRNNNTNYPETYASRVVCSECGKRSGSQMTQLPQDTQYESTLTLRDTSFDRYSAIASACAKPTFPNGSTVMSQSWSGFYNPSSSFSEFMHHNNCWNQRNILPSYSQLHIIQRGDRMTSQVMVNQSPQPEKKVIKPPRVYNEVIQQRYPPLEPSTSGTLSTKSTDSLSNSSVDSGQGSGELSSQGHSSKELFDASFDLINQRNLPSYARMANAMDQILRLSTSLYSLLNMPADRNTSRDLLAKTNILLHIIEASPSVAFLPAENLAGTKKIIQDLQAESHRTGRPIIITSCFSASLRKLLKQILLLFTKIISRYLLDCTNKDRLLVIALEHLIHIMLFGEDMRLEAIRYGGLKAAYSFCKSQSTPNDTLRLLLRSLAVMCNAKKGAQQVLNLGGLDMITHILCTSSVPCGVEAAGVLTQLTNPNRGFMKLTSSIESIAARLLDIIDACTSGESLLLCVAATANISVQSYNVVSILYQHNAIKRLIAALNRPKCSTVFVQEQIVTIFSRMAVKGYEEALIAQGAIPVLFSMLKIFDPMFTDYSRRIQYKAAVCLGTISSKGVGLKAIYQNNGYAIISKISESENVTNNPVGRICSTIKDKLEMKYEIESAV